MGHTGVYWIRQLQPAFHPGVQQDRCSTYLDAQDEFSNQYPAPEVDSMVDDDDDDDDDFTPADVMSIGVYLVINTILFISKPILTRNQASYPPTLG